VEAIDSEQLFNTKVANDELLKDLIVPIGAGEDIGSSRLVIFDYYLQALDPAGTSLSEYATKNLSQQYNIIEANIVKMILTSISARIPYNNQLSVNIASLEEYQLQVLETANQSFNGNKILNIQYINDAVEFADVCILSISRYFTAENCSREDLLDLTPVLLRSKKYVFVVCHSGALERIEAIQSMAENVNSKTIHIWINETNLPFFSQFGELPPRGDTTGLRI
jgi:hypothetical protein